MRRKREEKDERKDQERGERNQQRERGIRKKGNKTR